MSYLTEKMSYIRGLAEGLDIDDSTKEGKLLLAIVEAISDMADEVYEIEDLQEEMQLQLDEVDEDLDELEDFVYGEYDDDEFEDEFDDDEEFCVECPNCHDMICLEAETLEENDTIVCPGCQEEIKIEIHDCENCCSCEE